MPVAAAVVAGAAGLAAIAVATFTYPDATPFPGTAALLPALGAGAIIAAGVVAPLRLLTLRPVRYVGRISYSLYLWHWPAVILADAAWGPLGVAAGAAVVAATMVPAAATYHWVEQPFRRSERLTLRPRRALAVGSGFSCAGVLAAILLIVVQPSFRTAAAADVEGAEALGHHAAVQRSATAVAPNPAEAGDDSGKLHADGCLVDPLDTRSGECAYADTSSETSVVLFGDSHAMQYFPALEPIAIDRGWRLVGLTKAGCPPIDAPVWNPKLNRDYTECLEWRDDALRRIEEERPSLIVVSAAAYYSPAVDGEKIDDAEAKQEILTAGYVEMLERLRETGAEVVVVKDLPHAPYDVSDCVSESLGDLDECAFEIGEARGGYAGRVDVAAAEAVEGVELLDVVPAICPDGVCRAVIGNAIVYRGTNHLTATFAATLAKRLERGLPHVGR